MVKGKADTKKKEEDGKYGTLSLWKQEEMERGQGGEKEQKEKS